MSTMVGRMSIFLGIALIDLASCGSKTAVGEKNDCPDRMFRYVSPWLGWSACLPIASDLVIDTSDTNPFNTGRSEIDGAPMVFSERARIKALYELNEWIRSDERGAEPIDPADTAIAMRSFFMYTFPLDSIGPDHEVYFDQSLEEQRKGKERYLKEKVRFTPAEAWPENRVTTLVNIHGKGFVRTMERGVFNDPAHGWFAVGQMTLEYFGKDRTFTFKGIVQLRDTTCGIECMEKDTTILLYDRIIDSVDW